MAIEPWNLFRGHRKPLRALSGLPGSLVPGNARRLVPGKNRAFVVRLALHHTRRLVPGKKIAYGTPKISLVPGNTRQKKLWRLFVLSHSGVRNTRLARFFEGNSPGMPGRNVFTGEAARWIFTICAMCVSGSFASRSVHLLRNSCN